MVGLKRALFVLLATAGLFGSSGCCCCCSPCNGCGNGCGLFRRHCLPDDYRGAGSYYCDCGCGELYCGDWHSSPPKCCDPCDCCGNYIGPQEQTPWYQMPPRAGTTGAASAPPIDMSAPNSAPPPSAPPMSPKSSTRSSRRSSVVRTSYDSAPHCATCGN